MMIFSATQQAGPTYQPGTAARRALDDLLSRIYEPSTRAWLARQLSTLQEGRGVHISCGNGHESLMLASILGDQTTLVGIDEDAAVVQAARRAGVLQNRESVQFLVVDPISWETNQAFDFAYTRIWAGSWPAQLALLQSIQRNLTPDGILLVEIMTLSGFKAYPYNHAFARSMELIGILENAQLGTTIPTENVQAMLQPAGFELLESNTGLPAFVSRADNCVVSLALEACRDAILQCRGSTAEELNALLFELKEFELQDDTLISRPGLLQLTARPTFPNQTTI